MVRIGVMSFMVHGLTNPRFKYQDTMSKSFREFNKYDIVLANPPFKGSIDKGDIWEEAEISTTKTELLFVDRIIQLLKPGGRAAVIVPDGVLFGSSKAHKAIRKILVEEVRLANNDFSSFWCVQALCWCINWNSVLHQREHDRQGLVL